MIQLVEGADRSLTGRYVQTRLLASGSLQQANSSVAGAYNGQTIVVTIKPTELLAGSMTASGNVDGASLHLAGGGYGATFDLHLIRSDETEFQAAVALL